MSFIETVLDGSNARERKKKALCAVAIVITAILLVIAIVAFSICQIVVGSSEESSTEEPKKHTIEQTKLIELAQNAIYTGNLLTLDNTHRYRGEVKGELLEGRADRPKLADGVTNAYTVLKAKQSKYILTSAAAIELNKMLTAFYNSTKNEYLIIQTAYDIDNYTSQDAIYTAGTAVEFTYFSNPENFQEKKTIVGVQIYNWLYQNAHKYGFIALSSDSNVFRYVGVQFATAIRASGLSFNEFTAKLKLATPENPVFLDANTATYYCPINNVQVPVNYEYKTDGDNDGGVYVTVDLTKQKNS